MGDVLTTLSCFLFGCSAAYSLDNPTVFYQIQSDTGVISEVPAGDITGLLNCINMSRPTVMYIHGWRESCYNLSATTMMTAFGCYDGYNRICVNWSPYSLRDYVTAAISAVSIVANIIAKDIAALCDSGFNTRALHIVGFSMGAHVAGLVGNIQKSTTCKIVGRITALEAASPGFYPFGLRAFKSTDANMTYACHSDGGVYGAKAPIAKFDFFLNNGTRTQPGCTPAPTIIDANSVKPIYRCSHDRCYQYFAEALCRIASHIVLKCESYEKFTNNSCVNNSKVFISLEMPTDVSGTHYCNTSSQFPLGEGFAGITP